MFTGIIQEIGIVRKIDKKTRFTTVIITARKILKGKKIGESIAVNGVCVTITKMEKDSFSCDLIPETLKKSNLIKLKNKDEVNLEPALTLNQSLDGNLVQGHIDTIGLVKELNQKTERTILTIEFPLEIAQYLAFKGTITINGVSLTITDLQEKDFSVELIPHTLENTNLKNLKKGDPVNLEVDLIARYLERLLLAKDKEAKYFFLKERNLI